MREFEPNEAVSVWNEVADEPLSEEIGNKTKFGMFVWGSGVGYLGWGTMESHADNRDRAADLLEKWALALRASAAECRNEHS
jgi:hypothetical protein